MRVKQIIILFVILLLIFTGCSTEEDQNLESEDENTIDVQPDEEVEVIAENLEVPWSIDKLDNTFYLTERPGNIVMIEDGNMERQEVQLKKKVSTASEAGLLGFVLAPDFTESKKAFAYYTYEENNQQSNRIVTLRLNENTWQENELLLDDIPSGTYHHGGRLAIGPDEKLYATTGDASEAEIAQDINSRGGKILRMNLDGSIPSDNPFEDSPVFSYGHRNPQGITWSSDETLYSSEHGNSANDEINKIEAGKNYGWPVIEGQEENADMISPLFTSGNETTWAPSGMDFVNRKLYVAGLRGTAILEFNLETGEQREVVSDFGRIRDVLIDDTSLYFISNATDGRGSPEGNDDKLYRMRLP
ncbi:PQQ-dependent sugar dehydrogenase [Saliterribacillus persicus]|uniref:Glucose/arabinose dehydrogenase n=1 Tax=Saliterribacillus persicus TaxID=930114 RepID=A0A368XUR9_9BACI|nr:PQQ-dependent sugar dehydrogenase [Saliterribacillus persicus]RCW69774.1 glucose/arabinose dehydrogenase [Saliterribacillus persicus]